MKEHVVINSNLSFLFLEDSESDFEIIKELLNDEGFDFTFKRVENEQDYTKELESNEFDIILSDFSLPGFNAFGALKIASDKCPDTPFIVVSGSIGEETAIELIKLGAVDYVLKDKPDRLPFTVKRALEEVEEKQARKQAEEILANEQYLMKMLLDNVPDHIYFKNIESKFIRINNAQATSFGLNDPQEAVGKSDFDFFKVEHATQAYEDEQTIIKTGAPIIAKEEKAIRTDKSESWVTTTKMPLRDKLGNIIGTFGVSSDITQRKKAEEAITKRIADLEYFHSFVVKRELKMVELKKEINQLLKELGRDNEYIFK
ncbi:MAG: PAS domain-containing protein [Paludibacter sp.]